MSSSRQSLWIGIRGFFRKIPFFLFFYQKYRSHVTYQKFRSDYHAFDAESATAPARFSIRWDDRFPCLADNTGNTYIDRHYVYHTAWAARVLARTMPIKHVDISSYVYFSTIVSAFIPVQFYDYRPVMFGLDNLRSDYADLNRLPFESGIIHSLSCMHVVEHIGLGRYGDAIDPDGDLKAIAELKRVLAPGGQLLFVVPVGEPKIEFNAHRIYGYEQVLEYFSELKLEEFSLVPDSQEQGGLILNASASQVPSLRYGCGCFLFRRSIESP